MTDSLMGVEQQISRTVKSGSLNSPPRNSIGEPALGQTVASRRAFLALGMTVGALAITACEQRVMVSIDPPRLAQTPTTRTSGTQATPRPINRTDDGSLQRNLSEYMREQRGAYGVAIRDLRGPVYASYEESDRFPMGSLYKVPLMSAVMRQIRAKRITLQTTVQTLPDYAFGEPKGGVPPATTLTVEAALMAMVTISSNAAALALVELVGAEQLQNAPATCGLRETAIEVESAGGPGRYEIDARSTARDLTTLFTSMDQQKLVGIEQDKQMVDLLLRQQISDRLPKLLPKNIAIAHKTADLDSFTHDVGIVYLADRPFVIAVMAQGPSPTEGRQVVAEIAQLAFNYFKGLA